VGDVMALIIPWSTCDVVAGRVDQRLGWMSSFADQLTKGQPRHRHRPYKSYEGFAQPVVGALCRRKHRPADLHPSANMYGVCRLSGHSWIVHWPFE
jgi:hypothetical protein